MDKPKCWVKNVMNPTSTFFNNLTQMFSIFRVYMHYYLHTVNLMSFDHCCWMH